MDNEYYIKLMLTYMQDNDCDQNKFAERLDRSSAAVSNWISGKNGITPKNRQAILFVCRDQVKKLAKDVTITAATTDKKSSLPDEAIPIRDAGVKPMAVPVLSIAQAAGYEPAVEPLCDYLRETSDRTAIFYDVPENCFALEVSGDSMSPDYPNGSIALVVTGEYPQRGDIVAAKLSDGQVVIKEYHRKDNVITLESINPNGKNFEWHCKGQPGFVQWMWPVIEVNIRPRAKRWCSRVGR